MTQLDLETSTTDWVIDHPEVVSLFDQLCIDYTCGGKSLEFASSERDLAPEIVLQRVNNRLERGDDSGPENHQPIAGYHRDDENYWVAELACGHNQHVRHDPPWSNRDWTTTEQGRNAMIGFKLNCQKCADGEPKDV